MSGEPTCPFCEATNVERVGQWGGQIVTAQWRCRACNSYFEAVRDDFAGDDLLPDPARITIRRRIEWMDTDAAGLYHWTTAFRLAEAAEAGLHTALGIASHTFGATPRVAVQASFKRPLRFNDVADVELAVAAIGRSSVRYALKITGPEGLAVEGQITSCLVDRASGRAVSWPEDIRSLLARAGPSAQALASP